MHSSLVASTYYTKMTQTFLLRQWLSRFDQNQQRMNTIHWKKRPISVNFSQSAHSSNYSKLAIPQEIIKDVIYYQY